LKEFKRVLVERGSDYYIQLSY